VPAAMLVFAWVSLMMDMSLMDLSLLVGLVFAEGTLSLPNKPVFKG
jgi:hypothetical protein